MFDMDMKDLLAEDIMKQPVVCARPNQSLAELERLLFGAQITGAPVVENGRMVGVVSRSDIVRVQVLVESLDGEVSDRLQSADTGADGFQHAVQETFQGFRQRLGQLKVRDAMRRQVITCDPKTTVAQVAADMARQHVHRIIVVDGDRPVGVISSMDLVELVASGGLVKSEA